MSEQPKPGMVFLDVTIGRTLRIWWAWLWRVAIWVFVINFGFGFVLGFIGIWSTLSELDRFYVSFLSASVAGLFLQPLFLRRILKKDFGSFRVRLVSGKQISLNAPETWRGV